MVEEGIFILKDALMGLIIIGIVWLPLYLYLQSNVEIK